MSEPHFPPDRAATVRALLVERVKATHRRRRTVTTASAAVVSIAVAVLLVLGALFVRSGQAELAASAPTVISSQHPQWAAAVEARFRAFAEGESAGGAPFTTYVARVTPEQLRRALGENATGEYIDDVYLAVAIGEFTCAACHRPAGADPASLGGDTLFATYDLDTVAMQGFAEGALDVDLGALDVVYRFAGCPRASRDRRVAHFC
jgi:mono/diheme cytochrome c family protein